MWVKSRIYFNLSGFESETDGPLYKKTVITRSTHQNMFSSLKKKTNLLLHFGFETQQYCLLWPNTEKFVCTECSFLVFLLKWNQSQLNCIEIDLFRQCWTTISIAIECWKKLESKLVVFFEIFKMVSENRQHFGAPGLIVHSILLQI